MIISFKGSLWSEVFFTKTEIKNLAQHDFIKNWKLDEKESNSTLKITN